MKIYITKFELPLSMKFTNPPSSMWIAFFIVINRFVAHHPQTTFSFNIILPLQRFCLNGKKRFFFLSLIKCHRYEKERCEIGHKALFGCEIICMTTFKLLLSSHLCVYFFFFWPSISARNLYIARIQNNKKRSRLDSYCAYIWFISLCFS